MTTLWPPLSMATDQVILCVTYSLIKGFQNLSSLVDCPEPSIMRNPLGFHKYI